MRHALLIAAAAMSVGAPIVPVSVQAAPVARTSVNDRYEPFIAEASRRFGIPAAWIRAIIRVESGGDRHAISARGAMGLMQIMPETWAELRVRYGLGRDPLDARGNILAGAAFLREMHERYGSRGFLAAYNAGPGRYEDYRDRGRPLPVETLAYVARVLPLLGNDAGAMPILVAGHDAPSWTRAPIFIVRSADAKLVAGASSGAMSSRTQGDIPVRDLSAITPRSAGLFVAISAAERKL